MASATGVPTPAHVEFEPGVPLTAQRERLRALALALGADADAVDSEERFPSESLGLIRSSGLMGLLVPVELGGLGGRLADLALGARALGSGCLSTALIWAMHCQQVAVVERHGTPTLRERLLPAVAAGEAYLASVTSEQGKGGHLTSALAPLSWDDDGVQIARQAPVVTGGAEADGFLLTMRRDADAQPNEVVLAYAGRDQLRLEQRSPWTTMGVRGTQSGGMSLAGRIASWQVIDPPGGFEHVAATTMIPAGHVAWAGAWLGAAEGALRALAQALKDPQMRSRLRAIDDLAAERIARARIDIDVVEAFLRSYAADYDAVVAREGLSSPVLRSSAFHIRTNNLKVVASESAFSAVDRLVCFAGLGGGYRRGGPLPLERAFRDLRSAAIMYSNDRLLVASGKLALFETAVEPFVALASEPRQPETEA